MVRAFQNFKEIIGLESIQDKHRFWLKDYEGMNYSIADEGKHKIKWASDSKKYKDNLWNPEINCIKQLPHRLIIEFDDKDENKKKLKEKIKKNVEEVCAILELHNWGYIRSTHNGNSDYVWVEFTEKLTSKEKENFLAWICPEDAEIDMGFASHRKVQPVLFATHWKHSFEREKVVKYFEGEQIDFKILNIKPSKIVKKQEVTDDGFVYKTYIPQAIRFFTDKKHLAKQFLELQPLYYDSSKMWWIWDNYEFKWKIIDEVDILNEISKSSSADTISSTERNEILEALKQESRLRKPKPIKPTWLQFKDEIIDIHTGEIFKATPEYFVTNPIPWKMHNDNYELTPTMDRIFKEWVGEEYSKTLYEIIAYCLLPDYPIHRLFCFIGGGMNGKSCFMNLLKRFVGEENVTATELDTLITSRFEVTRLHKKLVCIMGETNFNEISKTSILKKLTGQDIIGFEYKNKTPFEDHNYAKVLIATNNLPTTTDKTIGFYRRWLIIDFPNRFSEKKEILKDIPDEEYEALALKCSHILKDLLEKREFHNEGSVEDRMKAYESKSDFLQEFLDQFVEQEIGAYISKNDFRKRFREWCKEFRHREMAENTLSKALKDKGIEPGRKYVDWLFDGKGGQIHIFQDIKWKN